MRDIEYSGTERYHPKVLLRLRPVSPASDSVELISRNTLYVKRSLNGRGGVLLDCSAVQLQDNKQLYQQMQKMFLVEEMFTGVNHTFAFVGGTHLDRRQSLLGDTKQQGMLLQFVEQLFAESNSSYRINTSIKCSIFQYCRSTFSDLLGLEPTTNPLRPQQHYLDGITEVQIKDVCDFMVYLRIALRAQLTQGGTQPADLIVRLRIVGFDEFTNTYYESQVHLIEYNHRQGFRSILLEDGELNNYLRPFSLENCKLMVVYCATDSLQELLDQTDDIQEVLKLRDCPVECRENVRIGCQLQYLSRLTRIAQDYETVEQLLARKYTSRQFSECVAGAFLEMRKFLDWTQQALQHCQEQFKQHMRSLLEYRRISKKVLQQRYLQEIQYVSGETIAMFWCEPLTKLHNYSGDSLLETIRSRVRQFLKDSAEKLANIRNLVKLEAEAKAISGILIQTYAAIVNRLGRLMLEEGRHEIVDKFVTVQRVGKEFEWLYFGIKQLRRLNMKAAKQQRTKQSHGLLPRALPKGNMTRNESSLVASRRVSPSKGRLRYLSNFEDENSRSHQPSQLPLIQKWGQVGFSK